MDVYGEAGKRAHGTGFVGIDAETEDAVDTIEVYEALVNPQESSSGGNKGGGGMMPPMMMGGGMGGAGGGGAASAGMSNAAAASSAAVGARAIPAGGSGAVIPGGTVPSAAPGVGSSLPAGGAGGGLGSGLGAGAGGGIGVPSHQPVGVMAAEAGDIGADGAVAPDGLGDTADADGHDASAVAGTTPAADSSLDPSVNGEGKDSAGGEGPSVDGDGRVVPDSVRTDVVTVDPVEIDRVAKEWSSLSESMAGLSTNISNLEAAKGDFGMVDMPEAVYGTMTAGLRRVTGGASEEFGQISQGLSATTRNVRENEESAAAAAEGIAT